MVKLEYYRDSINYKFKNKEPIYLMLLMNYIDKKKYDELYKNIIKEFKDKKINKEEFISKYNKVKNKAMNEVLDLIWKLLEERKVKVEEFDIVKYSNEGKESWDYRKEWYLDPCKIEDEKELKKRIEEWKEKVKNKYEYLVEKYGERSAEILFDIIEVLRADCYDWEIRID